jgi:CDGSH-type Zn-finger protein
MDKIDEDKGSPVPLHTTITMYDDGPYIVRGAFELVDERGRALRPPSRPLALCRCGRSLERPFCDGMHRLGTKAGRSPGVRDGRTKPSKAS